MGRFLQLGVVISAVAVAITVAVVVRGPEDAAISKVADDSELESLAIGGVLYEEFGAGPVRSLAADRVARRPLRLGPYALNPLQEIVIDSVRLVLRPAADVPAGEPSAFDSSSVARSIARVSGFGELALAGRIHINGLTVQAGESGAWRFELTAGSAEVDALLRHWDLGSGVTIVTQSAQRLRSERALWLDRGRRVEVRGKFEFSDRDRRSTDTDAVFRLDPVDGLLTRLSPRARRARDPARARIR